MHTRPNPINAHRLARLIVLAQAAFTWAATAFFTDLVANRRRIRQRYRLLSLETLARAVRNLMIARAAQLFGKDRPLRAQRNYARPGFRRRTQPRNILRAMAGSRWRRFSRHGDFAARFWRLAHVLRHLSHYARVFLLRLARAGISRVRAILAVRPPHDAARSVAAPVALFANTS